MRTWFSTKAGLVYLSIFRRMRKSEKRSNILQGYFQLSTLNLSSNSMVKSCFFNLNILLSARLQNSDNFIVKDDYQKMM